MSFDGLLWVLIIAWAGSCGYYFWKISRIAKAHKVSVFGSFVKMSKPVRSMIRKLYLNMFIATIALILALLFAYFVSVSS